MVCMFRNQARFYLSHGLLSPKRRYDLTLELDSRIAVCGTSSNHLRIYNNRGVPSTLQLLQLVIFLLIRPPKSQPLQ